MRFGIIVGISNEILYCACENFEWIKFWQIATDETNGEENYGFSKFHERHFT